MANDISSNPWTLDTLGVVWNGRVKIVEIEWKTPTNIGDSLLLRGNDGKLILDATCEAALQSQVFRFVTWYNGLNLITLTSGVVRVHIK